MKNYICNKCGKEFDIWDKQHHFHIYREFGYGTKFDGDELQLNLCCSCMEEIIDSCTISPIKEKNT